MNRNTFYKGFIGNLHIYLIAIMSVGLMLYTGYRAYELSFTHDESFCYTRYVTHSFGYIVSYMNPTANNHILNTLLMKYLGNLFLPTEFVLRLPNLLAQIFYIIFSVLILRQLKNKFVLVIGFIILNFNPYLLEFFSLARGYGLSTSMMLMSIYYLIVYMEKKEQRQLLIAMIFALLALYSNFVLMHYFITLIAVFNLLFINNFYQKNKRWKGVLNMIFRKNIPILVIFMIALCISYEPVRKLVKYHELYDRGKVGFWHDTVISFIHNSLYRVDFPFNPLRYLMYLTVLMILIASVMFIIELKKNGYNLFRSKGIILLLLLIFPSLSSVFQHTIIGTQFLVSRTTLFFHPLLALVLIYLIYLAIQQKKISYPGYILAIFIASGMMFHTIRAANLEKTNEWDFDAQTKTMINDLEHAYIVDALTDRNTPPQITLGINWIYEPTINYYRLSKNLKWLKEVNRDGVRGKYDYYYTFKEDTNGLNLKYIIKTYNLHVDYKKTESLLGRDTLRY